MKLINKINKVRIEQRNLLNKRLKQFKAMRKASNEELFSELCYCLLTANFNAKRTIIIQEELKNEFLHLPQKELANRLKELGHRFPNTRANYIILARRIKDSLKELINSMPELELREWLANNIKGLGFKEASHFLRNIGFTNVAIIDFHIIDLLVREGLIKRPKSLSKKNYLIIEEMLRRIDSNLAELDLILWFIETGKILK